MAKEITRYIKKEVERELWTRAAGRCQFNGCNKLLYKSPVTQESVNISEKAHIYSFAKDGPRGWGPFIVNKKELNNIHNLMLMCHDCHRTIDQDKNGERYSAQLLRQWKNQHDQRVVIVTGISPEMKSHVVLYEASIGKEKSPIQDDQCFLAMFPDRFPAEEKAIRLSMSCDHEDMSDDYWRTERDNLYNSFHRKISPRIDENDPAHFSLFALAPQPLLVYLGELFTDKISVDVYQPIREPKTWRWQNSPDNFDFIINQPDNYNNQPVLAISLSDNISPVRITSIIGEKVSIWELTVGKEYLHNDFMRSKTQLSQFRKIFRKLMVLIKEKHGQSTPLQIFPAMPVSCAIEMGRVRMPKADMPWVMYDQNNKLGKFIKTIEIGAMQ